MKKKKLILLGILPPVFYFAASIVGGFSNEGYSQIKYSVSDLLVKEMNNVLLLDIIMLLSIVATIISCLAVVVYFERKRQQV